MEVGVKVAYSYFISKVRGPSSEGWGFVLEMLDIRVAWVIFWSGADGGWDVVHVHIFILPF